ncbi:MAG TPA: bifunctional folylpolyglutamate synthase/dihydrofolate synthase [Lachnospiraceae bacterium]|nr:bifunctional folylpolyglutamate synthase/dihydrofolate synthase [Lachnospiraceae bacterium]
MNYQEAVAYIDDTPRFTTKNTLENTRMVLAYMGHPERKMKLIHVAGSNGKGSVCAYLSSILVTAGKKVGLFTSPHLVDINERFQLCGQSASDELFLEAFEAVMDAVHALLKEKPGQFAHPTFFELLFLMGIYIFRKSGMEYAVLETGLGGRFDATNVIEKPLVTVITSISLEHTEYLGDTYAQIAGEKAGIIKEGCPVVYDGTRKDVEDVILEKAAAMHAKAYAIRPDMYKILMNTQKTIDFFMDTGYYLPMNVSISSVAEYQIMNAMEAVTAAHVLDTGLTEEDIHKGMEKMSWQGRMETVLPGVILDGAHNDSGVEEFVKTARKFQKDTKVTMLFSCVKEKDYEGMIRTICENISFESVIVTQIACDRHVPSGELAEIFRKYTKQPVQEIASIPEAFKTALDKRGDGILFCVGSLYLVGSLKSLLRSKEYA